MSRSLLVVGLLFIAAVAAYIPAEFRKGSATGMFLKLSTKLFKSSEFIAVYLV